MVDSPEPVIFWANNTVHNASPLSTEPEAGIDMEGPMGERTSAPMEKKLELLLDHLNEILVSPLASTAAAFPDRPMKK